MVPKKLIRKGITAFLKEGEWEAITDQKELNTLYDLKVREELEEINRAEHTDIMEFVDLIQVAWSYAKMNGFTDYQIHVAMRDKLLSKGGFYNLALNNLNPNNSSNAIYFKENDHGNT